MKKTVTAVTLVLAIAAAPACGPYFDDTYIVAASPDLVFQMPQLFLRNELKKLPPDPQAPATRSTLPEGLSLEQLCECEPFKSDEFEWLNTSVDPAITAELTDLYVALSATGREKESVIGICRNYYRIRARIYTIGGTNWFKPKALPLYEVFVTLGQVPREFSLYAEGACAFRQQDYGKAKAAFEAILALPTEQRRYKTLWAEFMLGRMAVMARRNQGLASAHPEILADPLPFFEQVRASAAEGFVDTHNLVGGTYQQEALLAAAAGDPVREFHQLARYNLAGDQQASWLALKLACAQLLGGDAIPPEVIADRLSRSVLAAYAASHVEAYPYHAEKVLAALDTPGAALTPYESGRLAWTACALGKFDQAQALVSQAPEEPYALWTSSRLRLRKGDLEGAMEALRKAAPMFSRDETWSTFGESQKLHYLPFEALHNEQGVLLLARSRYVDAMDLFLTGKSWMDAAYIAEHVLTLDELLVYYEKCRSQGLHGEKMSGFWGYVAYQEPPVRGDEDTNWDNSGVPLIERLQQLVGRRMLREGRYEDAAKLFPESWRHLAEAYARHSVAAASGHNKNQQAEHLVQSAHLLRHWGIELIGYETDPDFAYVDGAFFHEDSSEIRSDLVTWRGFAANIIKNEYSVPLSDEFARHEADQNAMKNLPEYIDLIKPSNDERRRLEVNLPKYYRRWHYRYVAADRYEQAAALLPNQTEKKAQALFYGAQVLEKVHEVQRIDKLYKALVRQCGKLDIGKEADRRRGIPDEPEDWALACGAKGINEAALALASDRLVSAK